MDGYTQRRRVFNQGGNVFEGYTGFGEVGDVPYFGFKLIHGFVLKLIR